MEGTLDADGLAEPITVGLHEGVALGRVEVGAGDGSAEGTLDADGLEEPVPVGFDEGITLGVELGVGDGSAEGTLDADGLEEPVPVGFDEGIALGVELGAGDGSAEGTLDVDGVEEPVTVGFDEGTSLGVEDGCCTVVGTKEGLLDGSRDGVEEGSGVVLLVGILEATGVGPALGWELGGAVGLWEGVEVGTSSSTVPLHLSCPFLFLEFRHKS
jgi:hypothetical protein